MHRSLALVLLVLCSPLDGQVRQIRVIHTNDIGGDLRDEGSSGGLGRIVSAVRHLESALPSLVVDAGNLLGPDILSSRDGGKSVIEAMRSVGYAAVGLGYHDFDYGIDTLSVRNREAGFPFLAANVKPDRPQDSLPFEPYVISEVNGVRIGIIGALDETIQSRMNPDSASDLVVTHPIKAVQASLSALSSYGVDLTILLFHADQKTTLEVARALPGLNLLISGGHTSATPEHTTTYFKLANGVHMATTPSGNGSVGYVDLSFVGEPGHLSLTGVSSHLFDARHLTPDPVVSARVDSVQRVFDTDRGRLLGKIEGVSIEGRGSAVANLMRLHTESEVGVVSRRTFQGIEVQDGFYQRDLNRLIRFDDVLVKLILQGKQLREIANRSKRFKQQPDGLLFAGLDVRTMFVNGRPLRNKEPYRIVTLRRLLQGESGYDQIEHSQTAYDTGISLRSLTSAGLEAWGTLSSSSFWELDLKPVWRSAWSVEGSFNQNYVDQTTAAYRAQGERVSFLRGETQTAWKTTTRYQLGYETSRSSTTLESLGDYGRAAGETTSDQFETDITHRRLAANLKVDPFVSAGFGTAFTKGSGGRPYQARASAGFERRFLKRWVAQFAARIQRDFAEDQTDYGAGITVTYRVRFKQGGRFSSKIESFFGLSDRKVVSIQNYNAFNFPLVGELSLTVRQNNFVYRLDKIRGVPVTGTAFRTDMTVGLTYGIDWKWL